MVETNHAGPGVMLMLLMQPLYLSLFVSPTRKVSSGQDPYNCQTLAVKKIIPR